ncbi:MAG TPA: AMIN domain-containing protein [Gammaproteobacteria bacterium]|nr:AMIN domain-containing protein [Gammaproteobacteria bacterium]
MLVCPSGASAAQTGASAAQTGASAAQTGASAAQTGASAAQTDIDGLRIHPSPGKTRIVFDLGQPVEYKMFRLRDPLRLVIDISSARFSSDVSNLVLEQTAIRQVRTASRNNGEDIRVVLDLNEEVQPNSFVLQPVMQYGHRLVIDLHGKDQPSLTVALKSQRTLTQMRDVIIAIDAGHGGDDPGALGPGKLYEKDVVLGIAKKLHVLFEQEPGFRSKLIREGDYYVALRKRTEIARSSQADVFLSIHADAFKTSKVSGASVYAISQKGATSETARWLAEKENMADLIGGVGSVSLGDREDEVAEILLDLAQTHSLSFSLEIGDSVLGNLKKVNKLHKKTVEQAAFAVLKSPEIPSLLIETGYISNPAEARKLATRSHQARLANAIFKGVKNSMQSRPPDGSYLAWVKQGKSDEAKTHVIERGDTLSEIAERYRVPFRKLKDFNGLRNDTIRLGQTLKIPPG